MLAAPPDAQLALIRAHPDLAGRLARQKQLTAESNREQAGAGLDDRQELRDGSVRDEIAITKREERCAAEVELIPPGERLRVSGAQSPVQRPETYDQTGGPDHQQEHHRQRSVEAQIVVAIVVRRNAAGDFRPDAPGGAEEQANEADAAFDAPRQQHDFEGVVQNNQQEQHRAGGREKGRNAGHLKRFL